MSIPKIIHLCWFGRGEYPALAVKCINSWKQYLKDYKIMIWNEDTYDVFSSDYTSVAYNARKWAFVSDYVRLDVLSKYGGIYMDTDLEVIKDFSCLLENKRYVSSYIEGGLITAGFIAVEKNHPFINEMLRFYKTYKYINDDGSLNMIMNPLIFTKTAIELYDFNIKADSFENDQITIYPLEYFMPYRKSIFGKNIYSHRKYIITGNTYAIHHDMGSWAKQKKISRAIKGIVRLLLPQKVYMQAKIEKYRKMLLRFNEG